ncbi:unnamed protein product [Meganyctiphanes norvegica]|uniref:Ataxin-3 homolog n=1 Tax=Meganyctiphanes norvegica TaxID=48144 RepID=A0AAV2RZ58_MEGNR
MDLIYHEKQDGLLCAQHCLNNLLQGQYFSAVDLADIANQMDAAEKAHMAELGVDTDDYRRFMEQPSVNFDDSGMFSVQVISSALRVWDMNLVPFNSSNPHAITAREAVVEESAYICNFREHWLTVRRLGYQWFNLNSLLTFPELISDTYLSLFLTQLRHEGYDIFIVSGPLPPCSADDVLRVTPATQAVKPKLIVDESESSSSKGRSRTAQSKQEDDLRSALAASLKKVGTEGIGTSVMTDETELQMALQMSTEGVTGAQVHSDEDDLQAAIQMSLQESSSAPQRRDSDEELLHQALSLSMQSQQAAPGPSASTGPPQTSTSPEHLSSTPNNHMVSNSEETAPPNAQEIREKRLAFLNKNKP